MPVHIATPPRRTPHQPIARRRLESVPVVPLMLPTVPAVHVAGMHGMGDNLHMRALVRQLMDDYVVYLETPWPCIFHELVGERLILVKKPTALRTQAKNMQREAAQYAATGAPPGTPSHRVWYPPELVRTKGSVFAAMAQSTQCDLTRADFRLPVPSAWYRKLAEHLDITTIDKPIMVYRPLIERTEWSGCANRNPDFHAYAEIFTAIRDRYYVISVADLVPKAEWIAGLRVDVDAEFHHGELSFEALAALMQQASMSYASPGFATILAQSVGTPSICVFGGYESGTSFSFGARFAPHLAIEPVNPCTCFSHTHKCQKGIDVPRAVARASIFVEDCSGHDSATDYRTDPRQLELAIA